MNGEPFLDGRVTLHCGDCLDVLPRLAKNSVDAFCGDPPYHLTSIVKRFGADDAKPALSAAQRRFAATGGADRAPGTDQYGRLSRGFMGKKWDGGDIAFCPDVWREVFRVLKPGAHLLAFGGTRTYHRMACAIEDAGFEIRDSIQWLYGSGFPKSLDVSKAIDKAAGAEREIVGRRPDWVVSDKWREAECRSDRPDGILDITAPATDAAREWQGWGTALKPACEPIILARKPLSESTIAANVLKWGTGALNIDGCRVEWLGPEDAAAGFADSRSRGTATQSNSIGKESRDGTNNYDPTTLKGRWPANLIHDGSDEVVGAFPETKSGELLAHHKKGGPSQIGTFNIRDRTGEAGDFGGDSGSAARFFYTAKADADDRLGSKHPTVKPLNLIQYLVRLITPKGGLVLDCFAGTGTTGEAAWREGMRAILIEREAEYQEDIRRRMALCLAGPDERARESAKARMKDKPVDHGPLFELSAYDAERDFSESINECYRAVKERVAKGGPGWPSEAAE